MAVAGTLSDPVLRDGLDATRESIGRAHHLPGYIYTSPEIFQLEKEKIFMKDWLCMARLEEVENPGDYVTFRVMGEPMLIVRDEDGGVHAMSNVCRHRGVEVASGSGNVSEFSCPYHGWTYDLAGKLVGAPYMKEAEGFNLSSCRLKPLRVGFWAGWIFVTFNDEAPPLEEYVSEFEKEYAFLKQEECRLADRIVTELECNWKLVIENFMDVYHVQVIHLDTFGSAISLEDFSVSLKDRGGFSVVYPAAPMVVGNKSLFGPMPWLKDKDESFAATGFLQPNLQMFVRIDDVQPFTIWPLAPDRTQVIIHTLMPKANLERPDFEEKIKLYHDFMVMVAEEDRAMVRSLQQGVASRAFRPGPMSALENNIHNTINGFLERIFDD